MIKKFEFTFAKNIKFELLFLLFNIEKEMLKANNIMFINVIFEIKYLIYHMVIKNNDKNFSYLPLYHSEQLVILTLQTIFWYYIQIFIFMFCSPMKKFLTFTVVIISMSINFKSGKIY